MNTKHTAGEWIAQGQLVTNGENNLAFCGYDNKEQAEANAKLMAASKDLYNAAYSALQAIYAMPKKKQGFYQYLIDSLLDAIQKANGTRIS